MSIRKCWGGIAVVAAMILLPATHAQQRGVPHIGYIYPAGGRQGASFELVIGGQFLNSAATILVSGGGVQATVTDLIRPITNKELNELRIQADELMARRAVVRKDFRMLENFRGFKADKGSKTSKGGEDKELEGLKKKYANATWTKEDEKSLQEVRRKASKAVRRPANPAIAEILVLHVNIAADATAGDREVRVNAPQGLSNPLLFKIGELPEFSKPAIKVIREDRPVKEGQGSKAWKYAGEKHETKVTLPVVINGQTMPGAVDRYRFAAHKGQHLVVAASARELIPYLADAVPGWFQATLTLYNAVGKEVAYDDDYRFNPDPVLFYQIPEDGDYVLEIRDSIYRGREDFVYRITVGEAPFITSIFPLGAPAHTQTVVTVKGWNLPQTSKVFDSQNKATGVYPFSLYKDPWLSQPMPFAVDDLPERLETGRNSQHRTAQAVTLPVIINGHIDHAGDKDYFKFTGKTGDQVIAEVLARRLNSPLDSELRLTDSAGKQIAFNDDFEDKGSGLETHHADSYLRATLPTNDTYYLEITDAQHQGGPEYAYRLRMGPPQPDFSLRVAPASVNVRAGGTVPITVYALRHDGFTNAIALVLKNTPRDFILNGGLIPAGQEQVRLTLTASSSAAQREFNLNIEGRAMVEGREVVHTAVPAEDMMQAFAYRHLVPVQELCVNIGGYFKQKANAQVLSPLPVKIPAGGVAHVKLNVPTSIPFGKLELELSDPPPGITLQKMTPSSGGSEIVLASDAAQVKPGLKGNLIVTIFLKSSSKSKKSKSTTQFRIPAATLPAIPFEITGP